MSAETLTPEATSTKMRFSIPWPRLRDFVTDVLAQSRVLKKAYPGLMHVLIFWGVTIQVVGTAINLMQMQLFVPFVELQFPRGGGYLAYELIMDVAGVMILAGALMAAFRRFVLRPATLKTNWDDVYAIGLLLLIPLLGFTTEGLRIAAVAPPWANWSPVGNLVAGLMLGTGLSAEAAYDAHTALFWLHVGAGVLFVASIPFTKLRHLVTGPLNIVLRPLGKPAALTPVEDLETAEVLGVDKAADFTSQQLLSFDACVSCGRCEELCPAACSGMPYSPRVFIQSLRENMVASLIAPNGNGAGPALSDSLREGYAWYCTTCGACTMNCPMYVNPVAEIIDMRRHDALMTGGVPNSVGLVLRNIERQNNPWALPAADREVWTEGLDVRVLQPGEETDVLLFVGCAFSFDDRSKQAGKAFVRLLQAAGVDFAILGMAENCCGETARRAGHEYLFQVLAGQNIQALNAVKFNRVVTQCTHCFNTLKNEYPQFGGDYEVQHYTEFLSEIAADLPAAVQDSLGTVTYQDPCYLGRYNDVYDAPRQLLDRAAGTRVEMAKRRENSFCCGGGGAQMWMETDPETRISNNRLAQALDADADVVATACPYCLLMLDDAIRTQGMGERVRVMDVAEVLAGQLEG